MIAAAFKRLSLVLSLMALSGCGALGALSDVATVPSVYDISAPQNGPVAQGGPLARDVIVELPTTSGVIDNDRIMIRPAANQAEYLPDARWGDEVPVMLQTLMVRSLENTNGLRYVGRRPLAGSGDFAIVTELVDFQAELLPGGETAVVSIRMTSRIVRELDASIIASRTFVARQAAASTATPVLVDAFDRAAQVVLLEFADWTMGALGRRLVVR